jgi:hypothetical protein
MATVAANASGELPEKAYAFSGQLHCHVQVSR